MGLTLGRNLHRPWTWKKGLGCCLEHGEGKPVTETRVSSHSDADIICGLGKNGNANWPKASRFHAAVNSHHHCTCNFPK
jgi:hypothetical protein